MVKAIASGNATADDCVHFAHREALRLAETDDLTGILNQAAFVRKTNDFPWEDKDRKYVLAYLDVKNFKMINDLYGFDTGDKLLKGLTRCINDCVKNEGFCARLLSDHFVAILPDETKSVHQFIKRIKKVWRIVCAHFSYQCRFWLLFNC